MPPQNYYQIFELKKDATQEEIKLAYRKLAHKYHPDKNRDEEFSEQKMKEINFIYSILSKPEKRKSYDETLGVKEYFDNFEWWYNQKKSWENIYCEELEVVDSTGIKTKIKTGQDIYYLVEIDKSVITWKYKQKEYFSVYIKKIFNPQKKDYFSEEFNFNKNKNPLCLVYFGNQDIIIYEDDFRSYWISEKNYKKIDVKKGLITALILLVLLIVGIYYLFITHPISKEQREEYHNNVESQKISQEYQDYLKNEYLATNGEINYIITNKYKICFKKTVKIIESVQMRNVPDLYGLTVGEVSKDSEVKILLYSEEKNSYKIMFNKLTGWVSASYLDNPVCDTDPWE